MWNKQNVVPLVILLLFFLPRILFAKPQESVTTSTSSGSTFTSLIDESLKTASEAKAAEADSKYHDDLKASTKLNQLLPNFDLSASMQRHTYDRPYTSNGVQTSNDGQNPTVGLSVSYDLQKFFGPDSALANQGAFYASVQKKLTKRSIVRSLKVGIFKIKEIDSEIVALNEQIRLFSKLDEILHKQKKLGVFNDLESRQFEIQKGLLNSDLQDRIQSQEEIFYALSNLTHLSISNLKDRISKINSMPTLRFASLQSTSKDSFKSLEDKTIVENLSQDYNLAKLEFDKHTRLALPTVFIRVLREWPTMASSDGPQQTAELGLTIPLSGFFTRSTEEHSLQSSLEKQHILLEKNLYEYKNLVSATLDHLERAQSETKMLSEIKIQSQKLVDKSVLFFSQKRTDVIGTMDIYQKHLQSTRLVLMNDLVIRTLDAELEYLIGDASL